MKKLLLIGICITMVAKMVYAYDKPNLYIKNDSLSKELYIEYIAEENEHCNSTIRLGHLYALEPAEMHESHWITSDFNAKCPFEVKVYSNKDQSDSSLVATYSSTYHAAIFEHAHTPQCSSKYKCDSQLQNANSQLIFKFKDIPDSDAKDSIGSENTVGHEVKKKVKLDPRILAFPWKAN